MNSTLPTYSYKSPALYNPRLWNANEVRAYYVARPTLLDRIVEDLRRESTNNHPQHRLIVGLRGMGKSTLLRRIAVAVEDDAHLNATWLPLNFPEEQYNVGSLSDFWLNCLDALSDLLESRGETTLSANLDAEVEHLDRKDGEGALGALIRAANAQKRRLLLLVDNIDLIFERIKAEDWKLRDALQAHPEILIVGASAKVLEDTYDYKAAFYDFFKVDELRGLTEAEMHETIVKLASIGNAQHIIVRIDADPARLRVLHTLTGGNPRTAVLLYGVLLKGIDGDVRSDLEGLLDEVTPLYKARFEELPAQSQQLLDKLALHWHPTNASTLAKQLGWKVNLVSAQLDRLISAGIVERVNAPKTKRLNFQIGERFFNIWYLMRTSRRQRRRLIWLVECLRGLYSSVELLNIAHSRISQGTFNVRDAETLVALSDAVDDLSYKRALTDRALEVFRSQAMKGLISEFFDFDNQDKDVKHRNEFYEIRDRTVESLLSLIKDDPENAIQTYFATSILDADDYKTLEEILRDSRQESQLQQVRDHLKRVSELSIAAFGAKGAANLAKAVQFGPITHISDKEGWEAYGIRESEPFFAAFHRVFYEYQKSIVDSAQEPRMRLKEDCETLLKFDDTGFVPWMILTIVLFLQIKVADARRAAVKVVTNSGTPVAISLQYLSLLVAFHETEWPSLALGVIERLDVSHNAELESAVHLAATSVSIGEGNKLLTVWDSIYRDGQTLPFRNALDAAVRADPTLLDLLAPEVKRPARDILAAISPQLLQATND